MGTPLSTLISALEEENEELIVSGTTTSSGGAGYLIDTARSEADDYWKGCYLYIKDSPESSIIGEERDITGNTSSSFRIDVAPNFPAVVPSGTDYEIRQKRSRAEYKAAVNFAVLSAQGWRNEMAVHNEYVVQEDKLDYDFPAGLLFLSEIWIEQRTILHKRTATGGAAGYLEDTEANFGDEVDGETVAIYGKTGAGQSRSITGHTGTKLNVSPDWTTVPDETSKYVVKKTSEDELAPRPVAAYRPDMAAQLIRFATEPSDQGQTILVIYEKAPVKLTLEADETSIPQMFIVLKGMVKVRKKEAGEEGESARSAEFDVKFYEAQAEVFKAQNPPYRLPMRLTTYPGGVGVSANWPYGNPLWG